MTYLTKAYAVLVFREHQSTGFPYFYQIKMHSQATLHCPWLKARKAGVPVLPKFFSDKLKKGFLF